MKKQKKELPGVHILGDLKDVKKLIAGLNKKKTVVVFQDGDEGVFYLELKGKFQPVTPKDLNHLAKDYRLVYFSFFPSRKKTEPVVQEPPQLIIPEKKVKKEKVVKEKKSVKMKSE